MNERFFLVNENGPTKLTIEDQARKKFRIQIGSEIQCSCGGGRTEHCVHTIFSLIRIFKVDEADPLIWQLSFVEREIQQILEGRDKALTRRMNPWEVRINGGVRAAAQRGLHQEARDILNEHDGNLQDLDDQINKILGKNNKQGKRQEVQQRKLDNDETCCVCYEIMQQDDNLAFCKFSCGRNLHTECMERWVKHKISNNQEVSCPMCRVDWGKNALEDLKEATKVHKEQKRIQRMEEQKNQIKNHKNGFLMSMNQQAQQVSDRSFKCSCCKRQILYDSKYQCLVCSDIHICKLCFIGSYHDHHQFILRQRPDKDWEPAFQEGIKPPCQNQEDSLALYQKVFMELQSRDISTENYQLLLNLENKLNGQLPLEKYCSMAYQKLNRNPQYYYDDVEIFNCVSCEQQILDKKESIFLKICTHKIHKTCFENLFKINQDDLIHQIQSSNSNKCPQCLKIIFEGLNEALKVPKLNQNKVIAKIQQIDKQKTKSKQDEMSKLVLQEMQEKSQPLSFGVSGLALNGNQQRLIQSENGNQNQERTAGRSHHRPPLAGGRIKNQNQVIQNKKIGILDTINNGLAISGETQDMMNFSLTATQISPQQNDHILQKISNQQQKHQQLQSLIKGNSFKKNQSLSTQEANQQIDLQSLYIAGNFNNKFNNQEHNTPQPQQLSQDNFGKSSFINLKSQNNKKQNLISGIRPPNSFTRDRSAVDQSKKLLDSENQMFGVMGNSLQTGQSISTQPSSHYPLVNQNHRNLQSDNRTVAEDFIQQRAERFNELLINKKAKDSIKNKLKEKGIDKTRSLQRNMQAPISKYYRENIDQSLLPSISNTRTLFGDNGINGISLYQ